MFILKHITEEMKLTPEVIMNGSKILKIQFENKTFVDSLSFLPMSLKKIPQVFGFEIEVVKGYWPHYFVRRENYNYVGNFPDHLYFGVDDMSVGKKEKFMQWYREQENNEFDFQKLFLLYCKDDCKILRKGVVQYCKLIQEIADVDPFRECMTLPAACLLASRRKFLQVDTIGLIPNGGYRLADTQSHSALMWLFYESEKTGLDIQHCGTVREKYLHGKKVDGYVMDEDGCETVYYFHGCLFHGCPLCFVDRTEKPGPQENTVEDRFEETRRWNSFYVTKV
jgi:hypothetical protein